MRAQKEGSTMKARQPITTPNKSADFLRSKREALGLSLSEAAGRIGISSQTLRRYEREGLSGKVRCSRVERVSKAYGITIDSLCSLMMQSA